MEKAKAGTIKMERKKSSDLCRTTSPILVRKKGRRRSSVKPPSMEEVKECNDIGICYIKPKENSEDTRNTHSRRNSSTTDGGRRRSTADGRRRRTSTSSIQSQESLEENSVRSDIITDDERKESSESFAELLSTIDKEFGNKDFFSEPMYNNETNWRDLSSLSDNLNENYKLSLDESVPEWIKNAVKNLNERNEKYSSTECVNGENSSVLPVNEEKKPVSENNPVRGNPQTYKNVNEIRSKNQPESILNVDHKLAENYRDDNSSETAKNGENYINEKKENECVPKRLTENSDNKLQNVPKRCFGKRNQGKKPWQPPPKTSQSTIELGINYKK